MKKPDKPHLRSSSHTPEYEPQLRTSFKTSPRSHILLGISPDDSDPIEETLRHNDSYIIFLAWLIVNGNTKFVHHAVLDLLVDDLIQNSRIKLWRALRDGVTIHSLKGFIRQIVHNEFINLVRQHKPMLPLPFDGDGELSQGRLMATDCEDVDGPEQIVERETTIAELLEKVAIKVAAMSTCQRTAMICKLKETVEDVPQLVAIFRKLGIEIEAIEWPQEKSDQVRLKASLSAARKKMRSLRSERVCT